MNPADDEADSLNAHIHTIRAHAELGAPEPPVDSLSREYMTGGANETDESPARARRLTHEMRRRALALRLYARRQEVKRCRKSHLLTPENTYHGKHGEQCRQCRNASRRKVA